MGKVSDFHQAWSPPEARKELLDELQLHLAWASRFDPNGPSRKHLRKLFATAAVLDLLEELVKAANR